jgi:hypothetical protein
MAAKTELAIAIAKTAPNRCIMLVMPDAFPISDVVTALRTAVGTVGKAIDMPIPATRSASTSLSLLAGAEARRSPQPRRHKYLADANPDVAPLAGVAAHAHALLGHDTELLRQAIGLLGPGRRPLAPPRRRNTSPGCCPASTRPRRSPCSTPRRTATPGRGRTGM